MTATALTPATTTVASDAATTSAVRRMWAVGAITGVVPSLVVIALVAIAEGAGVPMEVAENSTKPPEQIPLLGYGTVILGSTLVGLLLATAFDRRWTGRPRLHLRHHRAGADGRVVRLPGDDHGNDRHQGGARDHPRHPGGADHCGDRRPPCHRDGQRHRRLTSLSARTGPRHERAGALPRCGPFDATPWRSRSAPGDEPPA